MYPNLAWRIENATIATVGGAVACALVLVVLIVLWRRGGARPALLPLCGLLAIMLGLCAAGVLDAIGFRKGWDPAPYALGAQLSGTLVGSALIVAALLLRRRAATR
ncbi:MAG TPA: hypothetical protein VID73_02600 [Ktedonobacterales bacterium]